MKTNSFEGLQHQIERLVREHLAAQRRAATAAIERAFASEAAPRTAHARRPASGGRRAGSEMSELAERLYAAVRANPGETIAVIAAEVGETAKALHRPMIHLKRAGRVRSAGERTLTRYFPMPHTHKSA